MFYLTQNIWNMIISSVVNIRIVDELFHIFLIVLSLRKVLIAQLCPTLCDPTDCSPPGSSLLGILQARILEWVAIPFSRVSSWHRERIWVSCIAGRFFTIWATREVLEIDVYFILWHISLRTSHVQVFTVHMWPVAAALARAPASYLNWIIYVPDFQGISWRTWKVLYRHHG